MGITAGLAGLPIDSVIAAEPSVKKFKPLKFGILADIHRDCTSDAEERLDAFLKKVEVEKPDFIIDLGDFIHDPNPPKNQDFAKQFKTARCPAYHVIGNHELEKVSKKEIVPFLEMPAPYYSFDLGGYHCVVLDGNNIYSKGKFIDYEAGNYFKFLNDLSYVTDAQCEWLAADLKATKLPVFVFSHQSLLRDTPGISGIPNREYVQMILEKENERVGFNKIVACFNGHHHCDFYRCLNNIHYFGINTASHIWLNNKRVFLQDPLFCFVEINASGRFSLTGKTSQFPQTLEEIPSQSVRYGYQQTFTITDHVLNLLKG
ncbi:hypothetical protein FACS1894199_05620 [Bacteroidia bacterium]|nr:hypothetical protein FACS1894199_05620 [Bacteroidia bacterium]